MQDAVGLHKSAMKCARLEQVKWTMFCTSVASCVDAGDFGLEFVTSANLGPLSARNASA